MSAYASRRRCAARCGWSARSCRFSRDGVSVRELLPTMGSFEILFIRSFMSLVLLLFLLPGRLERFARAISGCTCCATSFHFGGQYAWVYAISILPLATVFAIEFTMPVWAAVLAMIFLGERLNQGRIVMLALGVVGRVRDAAAGTRGDPARRRW